MKKKLLKLVVIPILLIVLRVYYVQRAESLSKTQNSIQAKKEFIIWDASQFVKDLSGSPWFEYSFVDCRKVTENEVRQGEHSERNDVVLDLKGDNGPTLFFASEYARKLSDQPSLESTFERLGVDAHALHDDRCLDWKEAILAASETLTALKNEVKEYEKGGKYESGVLIVKSNPSSRVLVTGIYSNGSINFENQTFFTPQTLRLPTGKYLLNFKNDLLHVSAKKNVQIITGEKTEIEVNLMSK